MQRWRTLAPVEDVSTSAAAPQPAPCACGAALPVNAAYCARCGRRVGGAAARIGVVPLVAGAAVLAFALGFALGNRGGRDGTSHQAREEQVAAMRAKLSESERTTAQLRDRNDALRKQLMDRHDEVARQLAERNDALRKHLKERNEAVRQQLAERDVSIGVLAQQTEAVAQAAAQETAALEQTIRDGEAQLKAWVESQQAAQRTLPPAQDAEPAESATPEAADAFWARFETEHPNVNGRAIWEDSMRAAADELGSDHPNVRDRAASLFEANLARAESGTGTNDTPP